MDNSKINRLLNFDRSVYATLYWHPSNSYIVQLFQNIKEANKLYDRMKIEKGQLKEISRWFSVTTIYYSNRIEDTGVPLDETKELVQKILDSDDLSEQVKEFETLVNTCLFSVAR